MRLFRNDRVPSAEEGLELGQHGEREFGRLEHEWSLPPLQVRRLDRVRLLA